MQEAVQRSLQNTYSEAFFKDNVLILHYGCQNYEPYTTEIADISYQEGILTVTAEPKTSETGAKRGIEIWQIAVPRSQYNGNGVKWVAKDTEYIHAGYASWSMFAGVMDGSIYMVPDNTSRAPEESWPDVCIYVPYMAERGFVQIFPNPMTYSVDLLNLHGLNKAVDYAEPEQKCALLRSTGLTENFRLMSYPSASPENKTDQ